MNEEGELQKLLAAFEARHAYASLRLFCSKSPPRLVVEFSGALDTEASTDFYTLLLTAKTEAAREGGLCVSLTGVSYISSTGIGVLSSTMMEYERIRIPFSIRSVPVRVRALFEQLGVWNYFRVEPEAKCDDA